MIISLAALARTNVSTSKYKYVYSCCTTVIHDCNELRTGQSRTKRSNATPTTMMKEQMSPLTEAGRSERKAPAHHRRRWNLTAFVLAGLLVATFLAILFGFLQPETETCTLIGCDNYIGVNATAIEEAMNTEGGSVTFDFCMDATWCVNGTITKANQDKIYHGWKYEPESSILSIRLPSMPASEIERVRNVHFSAQTVSSKRWLLNSTRHAQFHLHYPNGEKCDHDYPCFFMVWKQIE